MPRRSIFNEPSSDHDPVAEQEEEEEVPDHQPSDFSVSDPGSETEQVPPTDDDEEQFSPDEEEETQDLPTGPDLETEAEDDPTKDNAAAISSEGEDGSDDVPYRWGDTIDTRRSVRDFYAVIASLDRDHNSALASHLYSAHLIKRQGLSALTSSSSSDSSTDTTSRKRRRHSPTRLADDTLLPRSKRFITNSWTSWPHPPHHVPREAEHNPHGLKSQPRSSHIDAATYEEQVKREPATATDTAPSRMLEEVLTAVFLREGKERLRARGNEVEGLVPVLDAEVSTHMLRPVVRNIISRLDALLVGLYHERTYAKALMKEEEEEEKKKAAAAAAAVQEGPRKRRKVSGYKKPQAQRQRTLPKRAVTPMTDTEEEEEEEEEQARADDTYDDSQDRSQQQGRRRGRALPKLAKKWAKKRQMRLRLRDWSNIVGVAALTGFEQEVVQRTVKRCEGGFGQTMGWRRLAHDDHLEGQKSGDEWTGARPEVGWEGIDEDEMYKGIHRDGFMEPVRIRPKRNDMRVRSKYKDQG